MPHTLNIANFPDDLRDQLTEMAQRKYGRGNTRSLLIIEILKAYVKVNLDKQK